MQPVFFVTNIQPHSHNKSRDKIKFKEIYANEFIDNYSHLYKNLPLDKQQLQSKIVYIYNNLQRGCIPDVDNLSKPIIDSFVGVIYKDDKQIIKREAIRIDLKDYQFVTVDMTNIPFEIVKDFEKFITRGEKHIVFLTVDSIELNEIRVGEM